MMDISNTPHRRYNPLTGAWVLISPHRALRPWQPSEERLIIKPSNNHEPDCPFCPKNTRISGKKNPNYMGTHVFNNDSPALFPGSEFTLNNTSLLLQADCAVGTSKIVCYSPHHNKSLASLEASEILALINTLAAQVVELKQEYQWIQIFETRSENQSIQHPHCQIWASKHMPAEAAREELHQLAYYTTHGKNLLLDYTELELKQAERIVLENNDWLVVIPFWAMWPFETLLLPKFPVHHLPSLSLSQRQSLSQIIHDLQAKYTKLFKRPLVYSMGWHGAPYNNKANEHWQLHAHFYPSLSQTASGKKHVVGYDLLAEAQRDLTAEEAAKLLREQ